jgi:S1-C subfamily serine protease
MKSISLCWRCGAIVALLMLTCAVATAAVQQPVRLGVAVAPVDFAELERRGLDHGVAVRDTRPGGPADAAGVRRGDIIVALDGRPAYSPARLRWLATRAEAPDEIELEFWRDGESRSVTVDAGHANRRDSGRRGSNGAGEAYLGIRMQPLTADLRAAFGVDGDRGILVAGVVDDSPAAAVGIAAGDVLVGLAGEDIGRLADVYATMAACEPGDRVEVRLVRDGEEQGLEVELGGVSPSRVHGRYPPQAPFHDWRDWSQPWREPGRYAPLPPSMPRSMWQRFDDPRLQRMPPHW